MSRHQSGPRSLTLKPLPLPANTLWDDADFSWDGIRAHGQQGSFPPGYLSAFGDYLRRQLSR